MVLFFLWQLMEGNFALFLIYALDHRHDFQNILLVIMVSGSIMSADFIKISILVL